MNKAIGLVAVLAVGAGVALLTLSGRPGAAPTRGADAWNVPDVGSLPDDEWGRMVRRGRELVSHTAALIGPAAADPALRFAGNNLDCQSCHIAAGTKQFGLPYVGVYGDFPSYRAREGRIGTLEDRINGCLMRSMNGRAMPDASPEMKAMVAYIQFLSTGIPAGAKTKGRGSGKMAELTRAADPVRGHAVFVQTCAACHGQNGQGQRADDGAPGYAVPPLWGPDSFNDGAGMARLGTAANFVRSNMPHGADWRAPVVSEEDAWDVAAYLISQPRPHKDGLDADYPKRKEKPVDAPYGPYADSFSAAQHKYGPFGPIRKALGKE